MHGDTLQQLEDLLTISQTYFGAYDRAEPYSGIIVHAIGLDNPLYTEMTTDREIHLWVGDPSDKKDWLTITESTTLPDLVAMAEDLGAIDDKKAEAVREIVLS